MADLQQNNHKKRDPAYYRAYRKRKKAETADNLLAFPSFNKKLKPALNKKPLKGQTWFFVLGIVFTLAITLTLIHLSAPFYFLSHGTFMAYTMACIVEVGLVILVGLELRTKIDRVVRSFFGAVFGRIFIDSDSSNADSRRAEGYHRRVSGKGSTSSICGVIAE